MIFQLLMGFASIIVDLVPAARVAAEEKDLEIALLRQQLRILERKAGRKTRLSRPEKLMIVILADKLQGKSQRFRDRLGECVLLVKPDTLLKWHRELVRAKWTFRHPEVGGRPRLEADLEALIPKLVHTPPQAAESIYRSFHTDTPQQAAGSFIVRLARENPRMGYDKIQGELLKLGYELDRITVRNVMRRHHLAPAPRRV